MRRGQVPAPGPIPEPHGLRLPSCPAARDARWRPTAMTCERSPVDGRWLPRHPESHPATDRAVRAGHGGPWPDCHHHRPPALDGLRLLPLRSHRRPYRLQPGSVRSPTQGPPQRRPRTRPRRARAVLVTAERVDHAHAASGGAPEPQPPGWRRGPPSHAAGCVHHVRPGGRGPVAGGADRREHADPRTTTVSRRQSFDRHAAYLLVAFVAGG